MIVIDASVAVKWFLPEPMSDAADAILDDDVVRVAPEHILVEVGQALLRAWRANGITLDAVQKAMDAVGEVVQLTSTRDFATRAVAIAAEASCTNYDALYVAVADTLGGTLLTADDRLIDRLKSTRWSDRVRHLRAPQDP